jgi:hypothetical protein
LGSDVNLVESLPLDWGSQNAFNAVVKLIDEMEQTGDVLHGIYAMDEDVLRGTYQAYAVPEIADKITLVGSVCNGGRSLLRDGSQYGRQFNLPFWKPFWPLIRSSNTWRQVLSMRWFDSIQIQL